MDLAEQIEKLKSLHESGALSDEEFAQAKRRLLEAPARTSPEPSHSLPRPSGDPDASLGRAANRYVTVQVVMGLLGLIVFLVFLFSVILPGMSRARMGFPF